MPVPNTFANATATIPLSQLDANFATTITLGNTAIQLGNTVSTLNNMTLANVNISSGSVTITNAAITTANVTTANIATAIIANVTVSGTGTFAAGSNTAPSITTSGDTNTGIFFPAADTIAFAEGGVESMRIDSAGNVGIGTSSPTQPLSIRNAGSAYLDVAGGNRTLGTNSFTVGQASDGVVAFFQRENAAMYWATNSTERARITSGGDLLVGATSSFGTGLLQVQSATAGQMSLRHSSASAGAHWRIGPDSSGNDLIVYSSSTGGVYIQNTGTSWVGRSDERLKDIIEPITDAVSKVSNLRAVIGKFKTDEEGTRRSFLIAQDVQTVLPEAVSVSPKKEGEDTDYLGVAYTDVIPLLVAAIKEQQAIITQLQADVTALKGNT